VNVKTVPRDTILFVFGLLGIGYETLAQGGERPTLLLLFAGMVGLPVFLKGDDKAQKQKGETDV
jgi:hypothetical protein